MGLTNDLADADEADLPVPEKHEVADPDSMIYSVAIGGIGSGWDAIGMVHKPKRRR